MIYENVQKASQLKGANSYVSFQIRELSALVEGRPTSALTFHDCLTVPLGFNSVDEYAAIIKELQSNATILKAFVVTGGKISHLQTLDPQNLSKEFASPAQRLRIPTYCYFHHNIDMSSAFTKL